jgi:uncharacterized protein (DUF362 family)
MMRLVSLVKTSSNEALVNSISKALALIDFKPISLVNSILMKVNLCYYWKANTGYTTDPKLVSSLIDYFKGVFGENLKIMIAEADATAMRVKHSFKMLEYEKIAMEKNVELVNLSECDAIEKAVTVKNRKIEFKIPSILEKTDLFINIPKLKVMRATKITCAMKNLFGCIAYPQKIIYHPMLHEAIVGINKILNPHLTIVDGIVGLGKYPVKLNLIMAGTNTFSIDWVAARIMGYNPKRVNFLKLGIEEGLGNPNQIITVGEEPEAFRKRFPSEGLLSSKLWNIQVELLKMYCKVTGDIIPPVMEEN